MKLKPKEKKCPTVLHIHVGKINFSGCYRTENWLRGGSPTIEGFFQTVLKDKKEIFGKAKKNNRVQNYFMHSDLFLPTSVIRGILKMDMDTEFYSTF